MKQIIKEALDGIKKEKLNDFIFQQLDKRLSTHKVDRYSHRIFFAWEGRDDYYVMEYAINPKILYWDAEFWVSFFENYSIEIDECKHFVKIWVEKELNCKVDTFKGWPSGFRVKVGNS